MPSSTRLITNCDGTCTWSTLKFWSTFQTISFSSYRPLKSLTSYTRKLICIFTIFESLICLFSNLHKFLLSKALQEIFNPPNSLCRKGGKQCIMGNSNHSILCIYTNEFLLKMNQNKSSLSEAEPAITCNRKFTQSTLTSTKRNNSSILSLSTGK